MSESVRPSSAPSSSRPELSRVEIRTMEPPVNGHIIPGELLVSLTSTVCNKSRPRHNAHHRHCNDCGIRRPDAVWHHPFGRKKYKYFLEQPTSLTGAGRDISFLCDAMVNQRKPSPLPPLTDKTRNGNTQDLTVTENLIPEEYRIVTNKGVQSLKFYEDAFTVQLQDDEQNLRVFPSLRPSGRLEAVQLMRMMDDMLEKAGVDQQSEELTELSQMEGLLELVQIEQNIYNIVFHELIRQVSVGCAERGQLLAKLRQRYQSLLERIPHRLKALHTEVVAQRALDNRLTDEVNRIKMSMQELSIDLSKIREHDASVFHQAEHAHRQLAKALDQTHTSSDVVQGYHELYELHKGRLEAQLHRTIEERDCWSQFTLRLAMKVISVNKLKLVSRLHVCEQSWFQTAEHCVLYLSLKDTHDLNIIMKLTDNWREQLTAFMSQMKKTEQAQCEQISAINQGIIKWLSFCTTQNKCADPNYNKISLENMHKDLKQWSHTLVLQCERYQEEDLLGCQQTLGKLADVQEKWLNMSHQLFRRYSTPDGELPGGHQALRELEHELHKLLEQLNMQVNGDNVVLKQIVSLHSHMESWVPKLGAVIIRPQMMSDPDWLNLAKVLQTWQSSAEEAINISSMQSEKEKNKNNTDTYEETVNLLDKVQEFRTNLSIFTNGVNQKLSDEVNFIHMSQTHWMLELLLLMVPDYSDGLDKKQENYCTKDISLQTLDEDAKRLAEKLNYFSKSITSSYNVILEEQTMQNQHQDEGEKNECTKLQMECAEWVETCTVLLSNVKCGPGEMSIRQPVSVPSSTVLDPPANNTETPDKEESAKHKASSWAEGVEIEIKEEPTEVNWDYCKGTTEGQSAHQQQVELTVCDKPVVKLIGYDGNITERLLGESSVYLYGTDDLVVSPSTDNAWAAFNDLTTAGKLQQELYDSQLQVQTAEKRALVAEEALQAALQNIQDLERQLQSLSSLEHQITEETKETPPPLPPPVIPPQPAPPKKTPSETKPTTVTRKTRKH